MGDSMNTKLLKTIMILGCLVMGQPSEARRKPPEPPSVPTGLLPATLDRALAGRPEFHISINRPCASPCHFPQPEPEFQRLQRAALATGPGVLMGALDHASGRMRLSFLGKKTCEATVRLDWSAGAPVVQTHGRLPLLQADQFYAEIATFSLRTFRFAAGEMTGTGCTPARRDLLNHVLRAFDQLRSFEALSSVQIIAGHNSTDSSRPRYTGRAYGRLLLQGALGGGNTLVFRDRSINGKILVHDAPHWVRIYDFHGGGN